LTVGKTRRYTPGKANARREEGQLLETLPGSVLAVTDDLMFRSRIDLALRNAGIAVRFVPANRLFESVRESPPGLILIDYSDCGEHGIGALSSLKQDPATRAIPILAYGPHRDLSGRDRARNAGADAVLTNSQVAAELPMLVAEWIRKSSGGAS